MINNLDTIKKITYYSQAVLGVGPVGVCFFSESDTT